MKLNRLTRALAGLVVVLTLLIGCKTQTTVRVDPALPRLSIAELTRDAGAIVVGTVQKKIGVTRVKEPHEKTDRLYTDYAFIVEESLKGSYKVGDRVVLRLTGGQDESLTVVVPQEYAFSGGERTVLFLAKEMGPDGEAYILTAQQGIFDVDASNSVAKSRMPHLGAMPVEKLKAEIRQATSN